MKGRSLASQELRGILIPLLGRYLALPNAAVAEVVPATALEPEPGRPDWWLGRLNWRGQVIPVVSLELAMGHTPARPVKGERERILVFNTLNGSPDLPHVGMRIQGTLRLTRMKPSILEPISKPSLSSPLIRVELLINEVPAWIPDLDALERLVLGAMGPG